MNAVVLPRLRRVLWRIPPRCIRCGRGFGRGEKYWSWMLWHWQVMHTDCGYPKRSELSDIPWRDFWQKVEEAEEYVEEIVRSASLPTSYLSYRQVEEYVAKVLDTCSRDVLRMLWSLRDRCVYPEIAAQMEAWVDRLESRPWPPDPQLDWSSSCAERAVALVALAGWVQAGLYQEEEFVHA